MEPNLPRIHDLAGIADPATPPMVGGTSVATISTELIEKAKTAVADSLPFLKFVELVSAKQQVVAGMNYFFDVLMEDEDHKHFLYTMVVWEQAWLGKSQVTSINLKESK